jgi:hypothetical protein
MHSAATRLLRISRYPAPANWNSPPSMSDGFKTCAPLPTLVIGPSVSRPWRKVDATPLTSRLWAARYLQYYRAGSADIGPETQQPGAFTAL